MLASDVLIVGANVDGATFMVRLGVSFIVLGTEGLTPSCVINIGSEALWVCVGGIGRIGSTLGSEGAMGTDGGVADT